MAEDDEDEDEDDEDDEDGEGEPSQKGGKGKLFIIIGAVLFLVIGGIVAAYFMGFLDPLFGMGAEEGEVPTSEAPAEPVEKAKEGAPAEAISMANAVYYEMPEMVVNLNVSGKKPKFLKVQFNIALTTAEDVLLMDAKLPHILDNSQSYLRELRVVDLNGSAGMYRLREGVLLRVRAAVAPVQVLDVLFKQVLVQ